MKSISVWNRHRACQEIELIYGESLLRWVYATRLGQWLAEVFLSKFFFSWACGLYQSSRWSKRKISRFIRNFDIPMQEFEEGPFLSFNDFFIRKFKPGMRSFVQEQLFPAFVEARYLAYDQSCDLQSFPIKGHCLSRAELLGHSHKAQAFQKGPVFIARLCPTDYHRFHFPDSGTVIEQYSLNGKLHSVNPIALRYRQDILMINERQVSLLQTKNFGTLAYIEVGALCVGKIVQTSLRRSSYLRGDEKGYFLFGASTVIVLGEPGIWKPDGDLIQNTLLGIETKVCLGEAIASL